MEKSIHTFTLTQHSSTCTYFMFADIKRKKEKRRRKFSGKIVAASFCSRIWWNPMKKVVWACLFTTLKNLSPRTLCSIYFYIYYLRYLIKDGF